jgi:hypothetical protein
VTDTEVADPGLPGGAASSASKQRGRPFPKGQSGNPAGRREGSRNRASILAEQIMEDGAKSVVDAIMTAAAAGDMQAARIVMDRICPPRKSRTIRLDLPVVETAQDVLKALAVTVEAMGSGEIGPDEAATVAGVLEVKRRALETVEIEARLAALEARSEGK